MPTTYRLLVNQYAHVEDGNTGEIFTLLGPITFLLPDNFIPLHSGPQACVVVPPNHYVVIRNPVRREGPNADSASESHYKLLCDPAYANDLLLTPTRSQCLFGEREIRMASQSPFPLYPGEEAEEVKPIPLLGPDEALLLSVLEPMKPTTEDISKPSSRVRRSYSAGEYRIFRGPGQYQPDVREVVLKRLDPVVIHSGEALWLRAQRAFLEDGDGVNESDVQRSAAESWTRSREGLYFPHPHVEVVECLKAVHLSPSLAVLLEARFAYTDSRPQPPIRRQPGERWLVTFSEFQVILPNHNERVVSMVSRTIVGHQQYCRIKNPVVPKITSDGEHEGQKRMVPQWGALKLIKGPASFFCYPGEELIGGMVWDAYSCGEDEALLVGAVTAFTDESGKEVEPHATWLIHGPCRYIPPLTVEVLEWRRVTALRERQGVYVRHLTTGKVRAVFGTPFMVKAEEELWEKPISEKVRRLLHANVRQRSGFTGNGGPVNTNKQQSATDSAGHRYEGNIVYPSANFERFAVVTATLEESNLMRLYDSSTGASRVVCGPASVSLAPHEEFTVIALSGGRPKRPNKIDSLRLFLGPDYMADAVEVETLDHARLILSLSYNWEFDTSDMEMIMQKAFVVPDFIGEACRALASRVRSCIAGVTFEHFHLHSTSIIRQAIFCSSGDGSVEIKQPSGNLCFTANGLLITNVDVQQVQPADPRTLQALKKSVQLAVEIITKAQENEAAHQAALREQEAAGALEIQQMMDYSSTESQRLLLLDVETHNAEIELIGASSAHAVSQRESRMVEAEATQQSTDLRCRTLEAAQDAELDVLKRRMDTNLRLLKEKATLSVKKSVSLAAIEAEKYEKIMEALGKETIVAIAQAGPELQAKLLQSMGLQGYLITDGRTPLPFINLTKMTAAIPTTLS